MSPTYPPIDELELRIRAGRGAAVIVEGDSYEEDAWFYGQWFNDRARQVAFFPQNGWPRVLEAVAELRQRCHGAPPVYGIIDRDYAEDDALDADFPALGILRTPRYTLENYLLEPDCWAQVFAFVFTRQKSAPDGWSDPQQVRRYVEEAYRECLPLAAHNWVIKLGHERYPQAAAQTKESEHTYREHPDALRGIDPAAKLQAWGRQLGAAEDMGDLFADFLRRLEQGDLALWQRYVSGKYVLRSLHRRLPRRDRERFSLHHYLNMYMSACPNPPADLAGLVERIIRDAGL